MRVRKLAVTVFERLPQSLRLTAVNPKDLKTGTLSFTVSIYAARRLEAGRKEWTGERGDVCGTTIPLCSRQGFCIRDVLNAGRGKGSMRRTERKEMTDRLAVRRA
jgi:hypothetical protein